MAHTALDGRGLPHALVHVALGPLGGVTTASRARGRVQQASLRDALLEATTCNSQVAEPRERLRCAMRYPALHHESCTRKRGGGKVAGRPKETLASCDCLALGPCKRTLGMPAGSAVGKSGRPPQRHLRAMPLKPRRRGGPGERLGTLRHCHTQGSARRILRRSTHATHRAPPGTSSATVGHMTFCSGIAASNAATTGNGNRGWGTLPANRSERATHAANDSRARSALS